MAFDSARVSAAISQYGYTDTAIAEGLAYAQQRNAMTDNDAFRLAISRILYSDQQLADGEVFDGDIDEAETEVY